MYTVAELRAAMGLSQAAFADRLGATRRSVIKWEQGARVSTAWRIRIRCLARTYGLTKRTRGPMPIRYDPIKAESYLNRPSQSGRDWKRMSLQQRSSFWGHRVKYQRLLADVQSGRREAQPIVQLLDDAPDLDTGVDLQPQKRAKARSRRPRDRD